MTRYWYVFVAASVLFILSVFGPAISGQTQSAQSNVQRAPGPVLPATELQQLRTELNQAKVEINRLKGELQSFKQTYAQHRHELNIGMTYVKINGQDYFILLKSTPDWRWTDPPKNFPQ